MRKADKQVEMGNRSRSTNETIKEKKKQQKKKKEEKTLLPGHADKRLQIRPLTTQEPNSTRLMVVVMIMVATILLGRTSPQPEKLVTRLGLWLFNRRTLTSLHPPGDIRR